jgi:hypothetical protein
MTNRELLNTPKALLSEVDKQRLFLLRVEGQPMPCPACQKPINVFDAAGIPLDAYDFGKTNHAYRCATCGAELEQVVPAFSIGPLWSWQLKADWLQRQLDKAREFDRQARPEGGATPHEPR